MNNTKINLSIPIAFNKPNANGVIYTEEAIIKAVCALNESLPIIYRNDLNEKVIGATGSTNIVHWDSKNQVCNLIIDGYLFSSGVDIIINNVEDGKVTDFTITNLGITGEKDV